MKDNQQKRILELQARLDILSNNQETLSKEILALKKDLELLRRKEPSSRTSNITPAGSDPEISAKQSTSRRWRLQIPREIGSNMEAFIGGNLINKIGIIILVLGVGIGIKFAIDRELLSPLIRLLLGYTLGLGLLGVAFRTRKKYLNFSAVLSSGAVAILYFITYAGHSYYQIFSLSLAYILMIGITVFAVYLSLRYDREVISIIGLVGAYAVPFLLGSESENYLMLFLYVAIINMGILTVSVVKYWRWLLYAAFTVTWLMYISWLKTSFFAANDFGMAIIFGSIFFLLFYLAFINHKFIYQKKFQVEDIFLLIANSFVYYGVGYFLITEYQPSKGLTGLFTLGNAIIHFGVAILLYRRQHPDISLRQFITGLAITFITLTIPVEFKANWVTLFWFLEALVLFYAGRSRRVVFYEYFSYIILILGFYSLAGDWSLAFSSYQPEEPETRLIPFFNIFFMTGVIVMASTAVINRFHLKNYPGFPVEDPTLRNLINFMLAGLLIIICYYVFRNEIAIYWNQLYIDSEKEVRVALNSERTIMLRNPDLRWFRISWILIYSMFFAVILTIVNEKWLKKQQLIIPIMAINILAIVAFLVQGLYVMGELRESYLSPEAAWRFNPGVGNIMIRYAGLVMAIVLIIVNIRFIRKNSAVNRVLIFSELFGYLAFLWILTNELIQWQELSHGEESYRTGISILWGFYSLMMVIIGFWKRKRYLRIAAIIIFGITLIKLFFYDLADLDTISKTIVFISLGILLLIISFLYNKYSRLLPDQEDISRKTSETDRR